MDIRRSKSIVKSNVIAEEQIIQTARSKQRNIEQRSKRLWPTRTTLHTKAGYWAISFAMPGSRQKSLVIKREEGVHSKGIMVRRENHYKLLRRDNRIRTTCTSSPSRPTFAASFWAAFFVLPRPSAMQSPSSIAWTLQIGVVLVPGPRSLL